MVASTSRGIQRIEGVGERLHHTGKRTEYTENRKTILDRGTVFVFFVSYVVAAFSRSRLPGGTCGGGNSQVLSGSRDLLGCVFAALGGSRS
jgi:hypothetical protein